MDLKPIEPQFQLIQGNLESNVYILMIDGSNFAGVVHDGHGIHSLLGIKTESTIEFTIKRFANQDATQAGAGDDYNHTFPNIPDALGKSVEGICTGIHPKYGCNPYNGTCILRKIN